jgi:hypothetical protein
MRHETYRLFHLIIQGRMEGRQAPGRRETFWLENLRQWFGKSTMSQFRAVASKVRLLWWSPIFGEEASEEEEEKKTLIICVSWENVIILFLPLLGFRLQQLLIIWLKTTHHHTECLFFRPKLSPYFCVKEEALQFVTLSKNREEDSAQRMHLLQMDTKSKVAYRKLKGDLLSWANKLIDKVK